MAAGKIFPKSDDDVVIVEALRTPLCRSRKGGLAKVPPSTLFRAVLEALLHRTGGGVAGVDVEDVCVGNVLMPANGYLSLRMAHLCAGVPETTSMMTVNRQCASGLQAVANIAASIHSKSIRIGVGGGVESMSSNPMHKMKAPDVDWESMSDHRTAMDCLIPMGITSDTVAKEYGLKRHELDRFAAESHRRAALAAREGKFDAEIVPVNGITADDGIRPDTDVRVLSGLKPAFTPSGVTTAGNASQTTDGAAAVLLMTRREARSRNLPIRGVWRGYATAGVPPRIMGIGPAVAIPRVLRQIGLKTDDIDVYEINEAFASQAAWCVDNLGLDPERVNPNGGAIALGHPLGCTGARMIATLLNELHRRKGRLGVVSMCMGTGMGAAAVLEVEPQAAL